MSTFEGFVVGCIIAVLVIVGASCMWEMGAENTCADVNGRWDSGNVVCTMDTGSHTFEYPDWNTPYPREPQPKPWEDESKK